MVPGSVSFHPRIDVGPDNTTELSDAGYEFLIDLFNRYDKVCSLPEMEGVSYTIDMTRYVVFLKWKELVIP